MSQQEVLGVQVTGKGRHKKMDSADISMEKPHNHSHRNSYGTASFNHLLDQKSHEISTKQLSSHHGQPPNPAGAVRKLIVEP